MTTKSKQKVDKRQRASVLTLSKLRKYLQKGDIEAAAKEVGISRIWASRCMNGKATHWAFAENIIRRAEKNKSIQTRAEKI